MKQMKIAWNRRTGGKGKVIISNNWSQWYNISQAHQMIEEPLFWHLILFVCYQVMNLQGCRRQCISVCRGENKKTCRRNEWFTYSCKVRLNSCLFKECLNHFIFIQKQLQTPFNQILDLHSQLYQTKWKHLMQMNIKWNLLQF